MLTHDRELAADLAQDTWTRMLRSRSTLRPEGSFPAYLARIALNLWRDRRRAERRPGARLLSLESSDEEYALEEVLPDPLVGEETMSLRLDLDSAFARLPARLRAVVVARYIRGESAAEIGRRVGRSEQTITAWLREATARLREDLREWRPAA